MNLNNILGTRDDDNILNTILIIIIILIIILSFGNNNQVCGYTFGCFNPSNLLPTGVSPEQYERGKCCEPCCRPYNPGSCGPFGGSFFFIIAAIVIFCLFCSNNDKDDDDCC